MTDPEALIVIGTLIVGGVLFVATFVSVIAAVL